MNRVMDIVLRHFNRDAQPKGTCDVEYTPKGPDSTEKMNRELASLRNSRGLGKLLVSVVTLFGLIK